MKFGIISLFVLAFFPFIYLNKVAEVKSPSIKIAWSSFPHSYDPRDATDADSQYLEDLVHCSLINFNEQGSVVPSVAKSLIWEGPKTLRVELKDSFKFSDGRSVILDDVKSTYDFFLSGPNEADQKPSPRALAFRNVESLEKRDGALFFKLKKADASFETNLVVGILSKDLSHGPRIERSHKIESCGSFYHKESTLNEITLEKNIYHPEYQEKSISTVKILIVKDEATRFAKLRKGEVDIVQNGINFQKIASLDSYQGLTLLKENALKTSYLGFNFKHPLLKNPKIREAIAYGINKDNILEYILKGLGSKASTLLPPQNFYSSGKKRESSKFDPKKANDLLDKAGFLPKEGEKHRFSLTLTLTNNPTRYAVARSLVSDFSAIGIDLTVKVLEWGNFLKNVKKGQVDLWLLTWIGFKDPSIYNYAFSSESFPPNGANRGWYQNLVLDDLLVKGLNTYDLKKRKKVYEEIEDIVDYDRPYVFLYHDNNFAVIKKNIENFKIYADGRYSSLSKVIKNENK